MCLSELYGEMSLKTSTTINNDRIAAVPDYAILEANMCVFTFKNAFCKREIISIPFALSPHTMSCFSGPMSPVTGLVS